MRHDLIAKYCAHYILPRRCLKRISIFPILISGTDGNIFINYIGLVPIEKFVLSCRLYPDITRIVYGLASLICMSKLQDFICLGLLQTPKILKATFFSAISVFWLGYGIGEFGLHLHPI
jgi:hypothetical protein